MVDAADRAAKTFSGGMQRRLDLAASLVGQPRVLFLDEPTTGLDPRSRLAMWDTIRSLAAGGTTLLLTTQYLDEADELADEIVVIDHGVVIAAGTAEELKSRVGGDVLEFTVPDALVMRQVAHRIEHARESVRRQGIDPERMPWDYEKLIAELRPGAEKAVRRALLLEAIADKEAIAPTDADVDAEVEKLAQASQRPTPALRRMMEKSGDLEGLRQGIRDRMTLELLVANAKVRA